MIITNGLLALPGEKEPQRFDIKIEQGRIAEIGTFSNNGEVIDACGCLILPGGIDPHVHFNDPGYTDREDFYHGTCAAAAGGITSIIDMPCTSVPPVIDRAALDYKLEQIEPKAVVDFGLFGGVSAQSYERGYADLMTDLADDVLGFKTYFISGMDTFGRLKLFQFENVLKKARELDIPVLLHAEDYWYVTAATTPARAHGQDPIDYYHSRPEIAEIIAVSNAVELAVSHNAPLHIVHIGTSKAAELLENTHVTGETAPHYLCFDLDDFETIGAPLKVAPSIKSKENKEQLWHMLQQGTIDFVASDHASCPEKDKKTGSIWNDYSGIPGTGTLLPYLFSEGYLAGKLDLEQLVNVTSTNAAKRYNLSDTKGAIRVGCDADLTFIDPDRNWTVDGHSFLSKGRVTPFQGREFRGLITKTILRGTIIYDCDKGITALPGQGRFVRRHPAAGYSK